MQNFALEVVNVNDAPQIGAILANQQGTGGKPWQYRLPTNAFRDIDKGDVLTLSAKLDNGQPLPSWLKFDGKTGQFSGTLPSSEQASAYRIAVTATDKAGAQAKQVFNLSIAADIRTFKGTAGNDQISGTDGNDVLDGGAGNDSLFPMGGSDIIRFKGNFGQDTVFNGNNGYARIAEDYTVLEFPDLKAEDIVVSNKNNTDLIISTKNGNNKVTVINHFLRGEETGYRIDEIRLAYGRKLGRSEIRKLTQLSTSGDDILYGTVGSDTLNGGAGNDTLWAMEGDDNLSGGPGNDKLMADVGNDKLDGGLGDDELHGSDGNDELNGGDGNDYLEGGPGNDIYRFNGNFGQDYIQNKDRNSLRPGDQFDRIDFTDLQQQDLIFRRSGNNLLLVSKKYANNQVTVLDHFRDNGKTAARIDEIRFADGSRLYYDAINKLVQQPAGNPPRANLVQDRYAANAARQAQVMMQAMAASGAQPLDNLMTPDNPPLVPPLLSNLKP